MQNEDMTPLTVDAPSAITSHTRFPGLGSDKPVRRIRVSEEEMQAAKAILEDPDSGVRFTLPSDKNQDDD